MVAELRKPNIDSKRKGVYIDLPFFNGYEKMVKRLNQPYANFENLIPHANVVTTHWVGPGRFVGSSTFATLRHD